MTNNYFIQKAKWLKGLCKIVNALLKRRMHAPGYVLVAAGGSPGYAAK
jgi:hypothetical protein